MPIKDILAKLPEVVGPSQQRLGFKDKLKWTLIVLIGFFILGLIPLYGLGENALAQFEFLSIILGAKFGSLIPLGIGPLVTGSIVLQLLKGSGMLSLDISTPEGKQTYQGLQKILGLFFVVFEAAIYVYMGGLSPSAVLDPQTYKSMQLLLVAQLIIGGILILFMDEVITKWGFGSGISLFIVAGVSEEIVIAAFSPMTTAGTLAFGSGQAPIGKVWVLIQSLLSGNPAGAVLALSAIAATVVVFLISVYGQAMKIEIPLSFERVRGHGMRWPLQFIYTSNIPVILVAALLANVQLGARLLEKWGYPLLGTFSAGRPATGIVLWLQAPNLLESIITGSFIPKELAYAAAYMGFMVVGAVIFSIFWVQTAGMDANSQAKQILASGLQIPGFRRDERVLAHVIGRYIMPLTVMGAILVGVLASAADLLGALSRGTGILLSVMIIYKLYEDIAKQHMEDMYPALRNVMSGVK